LQDPEVQLLAGKLMRYANQPNVIVLGLPRGGVPVAFEVAKALRASLAVFFVRKLGTPGNREVAMGAIATGGVSDADVTDLLERARSCTASPDVAGAVETGGEE
jgi:putative phosphoribosyl transferase